MSGFDLHNLVELVSSTDSGGEDLAYTPEFQQILDAVGGQPERVMGDSLIPAVEPDWKRAIALGTDLLSRSKDLRISIFLCQALLQTEGFPGLDSGVALTLRLLAEHWDSVHPQLDPDDNDDPTERINALLNLCDRDAFLNPVRRASLASSRTFGVVSLRDVELARGESSVPAGDGSQLDAATIDAAFLDCDIERLHETAAAAASALGNIKAIEAIVIDRVGASDAPDLSPILDILSRIDRLLQERVAERSDGEGAQSPLSVNAEAPVNTTMSGPVEPVDPTGRSYASINSREDVVRMLDVLCGYYSRNEPSSPVPLLLQRARRLVTKDFMGIVQDLAPDAIAQIEAIRGKQGDE